MLLLTETNDSDVTNILEEDANGNKSAYISGIFAQADIKNRNGRLYPKGILEKQIENQQALIKERRALGELNHPNSPNINLERASHLITELKWKGNDVYGKAKILESLPMGQIARGLINEGVKFGVSTRGLGSVRNRNGINEVQNDFRLVCVDIVADPSAPDAFVNGLMENATWVLNPVTGLWEAQVMELKEQADKAGLTIEDKRVLFSKFLDILKG